MNAHARSWRTLRAGTPARTALLRVGVGLATFVAVVLVVLAFLDWNLLKGPIERMASARSGRTVKIGGPLEVHIWSWTPKASLTDLTIGNPPWEPARPMATVKQLSVTLQLLPLLKGAVVLPRVVIKEPDVYLHREASGRANWTFESTRPSNAPSPEPPDLPVVRDFIIDNGKLTIADDIRKLSFDAKIFAHEKQSSDEPRPFKIEGRGKLNQKPFALHVAGGPLINLDPGDPYPFDLAIEAGDVRITSNGVVPKPFDLSVLKFNVGLSGNDLADLYYLTQITFPNTPPFKLRANINRNAGVIRVSDIAGTLGRSDISGDLSVDVSRKRPSLSGDLKSKRLVLGDLAASLGKKTASAEDLSAAAPARASTVKQPKKGSDASAPPVALQVFPTARLQVDRVRGMDAKVHYAAGSIEAGSLPLKHVDFQINIDEGVLALQPFAFEMPQGRLSGTARIDARGDIPQTALDLRIRDVKLDQFKGKAPDAQAPLGGTIQGHVVLAGPGASVHDFVANSRGSATAVLPDGEIRAAFAELTGINVSRGLGLILKGDEQRAPVRCGVAEFQVRDGTMHAQNVVFDTQNVLITAGGEIRLGPEELDLAIKGQPKKLRLLRLRTPVELNGHLRKPTIGVNIGKTLSQGAVATAIGAVVAPLAAVIAFVDPGLAKDANCSALLAEANTRTAAATVPPAPATDGAAPDKAAADTSKRATATKR
ncbi:MAG TPA: AsmA family protein [Steroidobacteraceae bacterium]|nr:AsmA family protein [Steroidobacteraceae bacterium]